MRTLAEVARKHSHSAYVGLHKSLQQELTFVQQVVPGIGDAFDPVEETLWGTFLPALLQGLVEKAPDRRVTHLPVK